MAPKGHDYASCTDTNSSLGAVSTAEHRKIVAFLHACGFERTVLVGEEFAAANDGFEHYPDVEAVKSAFIKEKPVGKYMLIKGSNSMKLSRLIEVL